MNRIEGVYTLRGGKAERETVTEKNKVSANFL